MEGEVLKIRKELEKTVPKNDIKRALELLRSLESIPMTLDVLQKTHIGMAVNKIRKAVDSQEICSLSKSMVKKWKKLLSSSSSSSSSSTITSTPTTANTINTTTATTTTNNNTNVVPSSNNNINTSSATNNGNNSNNNSLSSQTNLSTLHVNDSNVSSQLSSTGGGGGSGGAASNLTTTSTIQSNQSDSSMSQQAHSATTSSAASTTSSLVSSNYNDARGSKIQDKAPKQTEVPSTTSEVRLKCRQLLTDALKKALPKELMTEPFLEEDILASRIEECIYQEFKGTDMKYKNRLRSRVSNLGDVKNPYLRLNVLRGDIPPEKIAKMSAEEMASDELKRQREKYTKEAINDHQMSLTTGTKTSEIKCPACKKYNVTYNQVQTRSADEPMTTFCYCNECGKRWKFC